MVYGQETLGDLHRKGEKEREGENSASAYTISGGGQKKKEGKPHAL